MFWRELLFSVYWRNEPSGQEKERFRCSFTGILRKIDVQ